MKRHIAILCTLIGVSSLTMTAAEPIFELNFDAKNLKPAVAAGNKLPLSSLTVNPETNFPAGKKGCGLVLSDDNAAKKESLTYSSTKNFNFPAGTVSFWFNPKSIKPGSSARIMHIYSPGKRAAGNVLIYYFFIDNKGNYNSQIMVTDKDKGTARAVVKIPAASIYEDFQKIDVTWDAKTLTVYHNGEKIESTELPEFFTEEAAGPRDWTALSILPVIASDGDNPANRIILDELKIYNAALPETDIKAAYEADTK